MSRKYLLSASALAFAAAGLVFAAPQVFSQNFVGVPAPSQFSGPAQPSTANGEWPAYAGDIKGTRYSPLAQVDASNFNRLQVAWRFKTDNFGPYPEWKLEGTPIMVKGVLYAATSQEVLALEPDTGRELWRYKPSTNPSRRGVAFWPGDKNNPARIVFTAGPKMIGLNAATGEMTDLVKAGIIDPAKVTRAALQNAASIAALVLTTECLVADKPEKAAGAAPAGMGGGMPGMGMM